MSWKAWEAKPERRPENNRRSPGAGFGSFLATILKLKPRDRRILVLAGAAGGLRLLRLHGRHAGRGLRLSGSSTGAGLGYPPRFFCPGGHRRVFCRVAKVPVSSIIMACEMCASYTLLVPLMLVSTISYLLLGRVSLYEKQVVTRLASPAHMTEFARGLLEEMYVADVVKPQPVVVVGEKMPLGQLIEVMANSQQIYFPVVDWGGRVTGILSISDIREVMFEESVHHLIVAKDVATPNVVRVFGQDSLQGALDKMVLLNVDELPVVKEEAPDEIIAMISKRDIIGYYH